MPDITMCRNHECPLKNDCYRYVAKPGHLQSYAKFEFKITEENKFLCIDYIYKRDMGVDV